MINLVFVLLLAGLLAAVLFWGIRVLPSEHWQIFATLPGRQRTADGRLQGRNLTWYGVLSANAYIAAVALLLVLLGSLGLPLAHIGLIAVPLLGACVPASSLVARLVEGKAHTFTVGGAVFVGFLLAPGIVLLGNRLLPQSEAQVLPVLAAIAVAYALGEGLGRLACLSFGCCYGKRLEDCPGWLQRVFARWSTIFLGETKKIAYASCLHGQRVLPVQALTAILYCAAALLGTALFLTGHFSAAFLLAVGVTQIWRVLSEVLRADHRGGGRLSAYQLMALAVVPLALILAAVFTSPAAAVPRLAEGLGFFLEPAAPLCLQALWLVIFLYTGCSRVTGASLSFHVHRDRI